MQHAARGERQTQAADHFTCLGVKPGSSAHVFLCLLHAVDVISQRGSESCFHCHCRDATSPGSPTHVRV